MLGADSLTTPSDDNNSSFAATIYHDIPCYTIKKPEKNVSVNHSLDVPKATMGSTVRHRDETDVSVPESGCPRIRVKTRASTFYSFLCFYKSGHRGNFRGFWPLSCLDVS